MSTYVYLIRNGDLYRIGRCRNPSKVLKSLKADEVIQTVLTPNSRSLIARLLKRYKPQRVNSSPYFQLTKSQLNDCIKILRDERRLPSTINEEVFIGATASIALSMAILFVSFYLKFSFFNTASLAIGIASLPMWLLFITGSFGGYDAVDVPFFSTWFNRFTGLFFALILSYSSFLLFIK